MKLSKRIFSNIILIIVTVTIYSFDNSNYKISSQLSEKLHYQNNSDKNLIWIFFKDKGNQPDNILLNPESLISNESRIRRMKRMKSDRIINEKDIQINSAYLSDIKEEGIEIKQKSKWLNAISCYADRQQIEILSDKNYISEIRLVQKYKKEYSTVSDKNEKNIQNNENDFLSEINYGPSLNQSNIINVPPVHDKGNSGEGVIVASFDAGFDNLQHRCFRKIREKGIRTYDFINGDTIVANGIGRLGDGAHGTITLSLVCGYDEGFLVSPAFNTKVILAKTENTQSETPLEEDNWIAAAEWADSLGADIITSSIGYLDFDPPYPSYTWESMDGNTALITIAADIAVSKGIVVVISSGNEGYNINHNTLSAPADGDSVITVGAVTALNIRANYSSVGPTADGRIKPDVMAQGSYNYTARYGAGSNSYISNYIGTSLACPMVAAVCALMLSVKPELTPIQVREILRNTSDSSMTPNNLRGWGLIDANLAVEKAINTNTNVPSGFELFQNFPNPFNPSTTFSFYLNNDANVSLIIYDIRGKEIDRVINNRLYSKGNGQISYTNPGLSSGVYFYTLFVNGNITGSRKMILIY